MSSNYAGDPTTFRDTLSLMTGGDTPTAQLFRVPLERLLDNVTYLRERLDLQVREDFSGAFDDSGASLLHASASLWRTNNTGSPAVNHRSGTAKNPGLLECAIPPDSGYEFHLGSNTGTPLSYDAFDLLEVVVKIEEDAANTGESIRFGLVDNANLQNGDADCLCLWRMRSVNATKWMLLKRVASVQTTTMLTSADFVDGEFAVWRLKKNELGGVDLVLNGTVVYTVAAADLPSGTANLSFWQSTGDTDTEVLTVTYDLILLRSAIGDRSGA